MEMAVGVEVSAANVALVTRLLGLVLGVELIRPGCGLPS